MSLSWTIKSTMICWTSFLTSSMIFFPFVPFSTMLARFTTPLPVSVSSAMLSNPNFCQRSFGARFIRWYRCSNSWRDWENKMDLFRNGDSFPQLLNCIPKAFHALFFTVFNTSNVSFTCLRMSGPISPVASLLYLAKKGNKLPAFNKEQVVYL